MPLSRSALLTPVLDWKMMYVPNLSRCHLCLALLTAVSAQEWFVLLILALFLFCFFRLVLNLHWRSEFCLRKPAQIQGIWILSPQTCTNQKYLNCVSPNLHKPKIRILSPHTCRNPASALRFFCSFSCKWVPSKMKCSCLSAKEHCTEKCRKMVAFTSASPHCGANVWIEVKEH